MAPKTRAAEAAEAAEQAVHQASELTQGKVPNSDVEMGHPIHPATVHWPIAFLSASFGITLLPLLPANLYPSFILPPAAALPSLAHYAAGAGVLTAIPSLITGFGEGYELVRNQYKIKGDWAAVFDDAWNMKSVGGRKVKMTVKHASMNDAVVALAGFNWWYGYMYPNTPLPKLCLALNALALPALLYSAMLGGRLVYEYAVGVQRQGTGKEVKEKMS